MNADEAKSQIEAKLDACLALMKPEERVVFLKKLQDALEVKP